MGSAFGLFQNEAQSYLHRLSVLFVSTLVCFTLDIAHFHLAKSISFGVTRLKNEAKSYLHGPCVLFVSALVWETNSLANCLFDCLFGVNTGYSAFAPRQNRICWGDTLRERDIVILAWAQCFVCFGFRFRYKSS